MKTQPGKLELPRYETGPGSQNCVDTGRFQTVMIHLPFLTGRLQVISCVTGPVTGVDFPTADRGHNEGRFFFFKWSSSIAAQSRVETCNIDIWASSVPQAAHAQLRELARSGSECDPVWHAILSLAHLHKHVETSQRKVPVDLLNKPVLK